MLSAPSEEPAVPQNCPSQEAQAAEHSPRPVDTCDPLDPLHFPRWQKWTTLAIVAGLYFMLSWTLSDIVPAFGQLQDQFKVDYSQINWAISMPALGMVVGPLLWSGVADICGRRVVFIVGTAVAFVASIGTAVASSYSGYMAARFFQGWGATPASTVGLSVINDIFAESERGLTTGIWVLAVDTGLLVGPLLGGFITLVSAAWTGWLTAILLGMVLLAEVVAMPETLYPRSAVLHQIRKAEITRTAANKSGQLATDRSDTSIADLTLPIRTKLLPFIKFKPIPSVTHPKLWDTTVRVVKLVAYPHISVPVLAYCFLWDQFLISVITMIPNAYAEDSPSIQGLRYVGLLVGMLFAEVTMSGLLSDYIIKRLVASDRPMQPEMRFWTMYPAILLSALGLVLFGVGIEKEYHWMLIQLAFFFLAAGIQMGNTSISSYMIACHPDYAMDIVTFYSVSLGLSSFVNPFFIYAWVESMGYALTFGIQAIIVVIMLPIIIVFHIKGEQIRRRAGTPTWAVSNDGINHKS